MAKQDLTVRFLAQDGISPSLANIRKSLQDTGRQASALDDIKAQFERIANSTAPAKRQLRDIQTLLANMNLYGLSDTSVFTEMAQYAGELRDALGDARQAVNAFADDQFKLEAMGQGLSLVASMGTTAATAMQLMGVENESAAKAVKQLQMAMTLLNSVQQVANYLNKDSALMLRLKQIRMLASAASTTADTAATTANTVAGGANTVAVTANNVARKAWNYTVAVGKALLGDWTGLVLVGATALAAYAVATSNSKDKLEEQAEAAKKAADKNEEFHVRVGQATGATVGKFMLLRAEWERLKTTAEKQQWIESNRAAFESLGLKVTDLTSAENVFVNNTGNVIKALEDRAKAAAIQEKMIENWKKYYDKLDEKNVANGGYYKVTKKYEGEWNHVGSKPLEWSGLIEGKHYKKWKNGNQWVYSLYQSGAEELVRQANQFAQEEARSRNAAYQADELAKTEGANAVLMKEFDDVNKRINANPANNLFGTNNTGGGGGGTNTNTTNTETIVEGSLKDLQQQLSDINKELTDTKPTDERIAQLLAEKSTLEQNISLLKEKLGLEKKAAEAEAGSISALNKERNDNNNLLRTSASLSEEEIQRIVERNDEIEKEIENLEIARNLRQKAAETSTIGITALPEGAVRGGVEDKRASYQYAAGMVQQLQEDVLLNIVGVDEALAQIQLINDALVALGMEPIVITVDGNQLLTAAESAQRTTDATNNAAQAMQSLGTAMSNLDQDGAIAKAAAIATAIGQLALSFAKSLSSSATIWDWIAGATAGIATLTSVVASISTFKDGGIVGGSSYTGDRVLVGLNSGEMVLNQSQQNRLWNAIESGNLGANAPQVVQFRIKGPDLVGTMRNFNSKTLRQS